MKFGMEVVGYSNIKAVFMMQEDVKLLTYIFFLFEVKKQKTF